MSQSNSFLPEPDDMVKLGRGWGRLFGHPWSVGVLSPAFQSLSAMIGFVSVDPLWIVATPLLFVILRPAVLWRAEVRGTDLCCFVGRREVLRVDLAKTGSVVVDTDPVGLYKSRGLRLVDATVVSFKPTRFLGRLPTEWSRARVDLDLWATNFASEKVLRSWLAVIGPLTEDGAVPWTGGWKAAGFYDRPRLIY